ncbi:MAG: class I fructose-bisphosphate aldolase [Patescibacteria group bacterium]
MKSLQDIAQKLAAQGTGILAADESIGTLHKRFEKRGIPQAEEMHRKWRELLFVTPGIERGLSGVILFDETIRQAGSDGILLRNTLLAKGIMFGIKVDKGAVGLTNFPDEKVTEGLDGLGVRLAEYAALGATFTKWRGVFTVGKGLPTPECIEANACIFSQFAALSQDALLVPIVEPEVLLGGTHDMQACEVALGRVLQTVFASLKKYRVNLSSLLLKTSMALPGKGLKEKAAPELVALSTVRVLKAVVPREVAGVVFLSGGQTPEEATKNLNATVLAGRKAKVPWPLTFSFSRALQDPVMDAWLGKDENVRAAQVIFQKRVEETARASEGKL